MIETILKISCLTVGGVVGLCLFIAPLVLGKADAKSTTDLPCFDAGQLSELFNAICKVESNDNPWAVNVAEKAVGVAQIRPIMVKDCNRIASILNLDIVFTPESRYERGASFLMFLLYSYWYGRQYMHETGYTPTNETLARNWCSGPTGYKKECSKQYWLKVKAILRKAKNNG